MEQPLTDQLINRPCLSPKWLLLLRIMPSHCSHRNTQHTLAFRDDAHCDDTDHTATSAFDGSGSMERHQICEVGYEDWRYLPPWMMKSVASLHLTLQRFTRLTAPTLVHHKPFRRSVHTSCQWLDHLIACCGTIRRSVEARVPPGSSWHQSTSWGGGHGETRHIGEIEATLAPW